MLTSRWRKSGYSACNGNCLEARWRKSSHSYSDGHCLEAAWHRSSRSHANGNCAEAALSGGTVLVRDSKLGASSPVLSFSPADWKTFLEGVKR